MKPINTHLMRTKNFQTIAWNNKHKFFIFILFLSISGCQKFYKVETTQVDGQLFFNSSVINKKCDGKVFISSFGIEYIGKDARHLAWDIAVKTRITGNETAIKFPIKYGEKFNDLETRVAPIKILPGEYRISATIACYSDEELIPLTLFGKYTINSDIKLVPMQVH